MAYQGHVVGLVLGLGGQSGSKNMAAVREDQLVVAENVSFEDVTIKKEGGAAKYNGTAITNTPSVLGGFDWDYDGATQRSVVMTDDGDVLMDDGAGDYNGGSTLASGLSVLSTTIPVFVEGGKEAAANNKKLFMFTGNSAVQVLSGSGTSMAALTTPPTDWSGGNQPAFGFIHEGCLWGGGNGNDPHRLYKSDVSDHEDFTGGTSASYSIYPGEGQRIAWAASFKGVIVCAKYPRGVYILDTTDPSSANWKISRISKVVGSAGPHCFAEIDDDVLVLDTVCRVHLLSTITEFGNLGSRSLSDVADYGAFLRSEIDFSGLRLAYGVYYAAKREAHFAVTGIGSSVNNRRIVVDFNRIDIPRFRLSTRDTPVSMWLKRDSNGVERLTTGDNAGFVWDLDQSTKSQDGSGYEARFQTPDLDFSFYDPTIGAINKDWDWLELAIEPKGDHDLSVAVFLDGELSETLQYNMGGSGATLGSFVLGTDKLAGTGLLNRRKEVHGRSRRISLIGSNSGAAQDFSIAKFYFGFRTSDTESIGG